MTDAAATQRAALRVRARFLGDLFAVTGTRELRVALPPGATVAGLLDALSQIYGEGFRARIFNGPAKLHHTMLIFVDGENIKDCGGLAAKLGRSDGGKEVEVEVIMLPMFGGG